MRTVNKTGIFIGISRGVQLNIKDRKNTENMEEMVNARGNQQDVPPVPKNAPYNV